MQNLIGIVLILFLLAIFLRIDFYFNIVYLLAAVYLLARVWTHTTSRNLTVQRRLVNRAFPDENIPVELIVSNSGRLPIPWIEVQDSLPVELISPPFHREVITLGARQTQRFNYTLTGHRRGYYTIGPLFMQTGDVLGVIPPLTWKQKPEYIIIYPRVLPLEKLGLPTHSPLAVLPARSPLFEDPTRIMGVRAYQRGDSPRRIHWTATARAGELLVKRYQPAIARETLICLDFAQESYAGRRFYDASELAIVTAASLANHIIIHERLAVGLATQAVDPLENDSQTFSLPPRRERAHLMNILEVLARAQTTPTPALPFPEFLRHESARLSWGTTIIVISGSESATLYETLAYLRSAGFALALILIMPPAPDDHLRQIATDKLPIYRVWRETELEVLL
ncbi:MAG TPA: DUF58 domain-containing protein [Anaerolineae bacterium]|nr:DUF58 domain-containing protein [Anaerolineae bacterium]HQK14617.1 DUF58 domain-containing protein [Anaerolineae bacterium]